MNRERRSDQAGYSMVEVLISMTILAVGILAVSALQVGSIQGNLNSRSMTEAAALGQGKMEELMGLDYDDLESSAAAEAAGRYSLSWTVDEDATLDNTKDIIIEVRWTEKGADKSVVIASIKASAG